MCEIEGICLDCADASSCPMLAAHRKFPGTLKSVMCIGYRHATPVGAVKDSPSILSSAEVLGTSSQFQQ
ncbi:MAG: hypothetical protein WED04_03830 [Promethearchaeati archaeon SRVP18_Atabeyarchaeia-1]